MTLQQRFNLMGKIHDWGGIVLVVGYIAIPTAIYLLAGQENVDRASSWVSATIKPYFFFMAFWFVPLPWGLRLFERCPGCKTSYTYREPDLDGTRNRSFHADLHCHKCGHSFVEVS